MNSAELDLDRIHHYTEIDNFIKNNPGKQIVIRTKNTTKLTNTFLRNFEARYGNKVQIRVLGAYDDQFFKNYPHLIDNMGNNNLYSLGEIKKIEKELENIESGLDPEWDDLEKIVYFIGQIKNKIIYHPFYEHQQSKSIRSLVGLYTNTTVCAGYSIILKELCDRNNIECKYVVGSCNKKDAEKNLTTHAWNIVKLNGQYVPIDLTWNAGKNKMGHLASIEDLGNINKFVECHYPCRQESIQNYKQTLKSIEGDKLREIDYIVNKDVVYDSTVMTYIRDDKSKFKITQVGEHVIGGEFLYKYVYERMNPDGSYGTPVMIYSQTNICKIREGIANRNKYKKKLQEAIKRNNKSEIDKINKILDQTKIYDELNKNLDILLSKENLEAARKRGNYYIGKIKVSKKDNQGFNEEKELYVDGVFIDREYEKNIPYQQKSFKRADGSMFVVESFGTVRHNNSTFNKYRIYEGINSDGKRKYKKNTIFTDINEDLIKENRPSIANDFLDRKRIDRKIKETAGYLGYYSKEGMRTYIAEHNNYFKKDLYKALSLKNKDFVDYFETITFDEMDRLVKTYDQRFIDDKIKYFNRQTKKEITDKEIIEHLDFSYLWLRAAGTKKYLYDEKIPGYSYAFNESSKEVFEIIKAVINENIEKTGEIDPTIILRKIKDVTKYKYSEEIIVSLFKGEKNAKIVNNIFKKQNPSARRNTKIKHFNNEFEAYARVAELEKKKEEIQDMMLEVKNENGNIVFSSNNKK